MTSCEPRHGDVRSHPFLGALIPAATARPETAHRSPCPRPSAWIRKREDSQPLSVPVRMAAACDERPCRLNQILKTGAKTVTSAHVLHHAERPSGRRTRRTSASACADPGRYRTRDCSPRVKGTIAKRQRLRAGAPRAKFRRSPAGARSASAEGSSQPARLAREQPQAPSSAAAEVQRAPARTPAQATRASGASLPLCEGTHRVVIHGIYSMPRTGPGRHPSRTFFTEPNSGACAVTRALCVASSRSVDLRRDVCLRRVAGDARWREWLAAGCARGTLDLGCGTGRRLAVVPERGAPGWARSFRGRTAARRRRAPEISLVRASAQALPFRDGAFDTVVSSLVFCSVRIRRRRLPKCAAFSAGRPAPHDGARARS